MSLQYAYHRKLTVNRLTGVLQYADSSAQRALTVSLSSVPVNKDSSKSIMQEAKLQMQYLLQCC